MDFVKTANNMSSINERWTLIKMKEKYVRFTFSERQPLSHKPVLENKMLDPLYESNTEIKTSAGKKLKI